MSEEIKQEGDFKIKTRKTTPRKLNKPEVTTKVELKDPEVTKVELDKEIVQPAAPEVVADVQPVVIADPVAEPEMLLKKLNKLKRLKLHRNKLKRLKKNTKH